MIRQERTFRHRFSLFLLHAGMGRGIRGRKTCRTHGFTLMEVLVVIALLGILLGMGLPHYGTYIDRSWRDQARNCLLATAQNMERIYTRDFRYPEEMPATPCHQNPELSKRYAWDLLEPISHTAYQLQVSPLKEAELLRCGKLQLDHTGRLLILAASSSRNCW